MCYLSSLNLAYLKSVGNNKSLKMEYEYESRQFTENKVVIVKFTQNQISKSRDGIENFTRYQIRYECLLKLDSLSLRWAYRRMRIQMRFSTNILIRWSFRQTFHSDEHFDMRFIQMRFLTWVSFWLAFWHTFHSDKFFDKYYIRMSFLSNIFVQMSFSTVNFIRMSLSVNISFWWAFRQKISFGWAFRQIFFTDEIFDKYYIRISFLTKNPLR